MVPRINHPHNQRNRMKKILALLATIATVGLISATPAQAASDYSTPWKCVSYRDISTCVSVDWSKQADGTGVRLEGFEVWTSNGCSSLEESGGRYNPVRPFFVNPATGATDYQYEFGAEPCNFYKDLSNAGRDVGSMDFRFNAHARIDLAADRDVLIGYNLQANGDYSIDYALAAE